MLNFAAESNKAPLKKRRTASPTPLESLGVDEASQKQKSSLLGDESDSGLNDEEDDGLTYERASAGMGALAPGRLNKEVRSIMKKFVQHYVDPKQQNARMSSLVLSPHFYPYYHENPLTSSERERVMATLADSFSGLEFKGNQMFLEQVFKLRPNVLQYINWVPFEKLTQYGGSRLRGNEVVMDQWIFSTEALEPGSRQLPGQLLNSQRQQETQAVHNYGVGFRTSLDYFMEPTKLNAYNKNLEALSATILQTMEKQLLQTMFQRSTQYRIRNKYQLPFTSEAHLDKVMSAMCNERFSVQKNGAGIRALESNAYNELRNIGLTPEAVLFSPEVMRHENVVNPEHRVLGRIGKSEREAAPAKEGSGYDLQTVRGMKTPTYGLAVNQSRSFRNMDTEEFEDPTHTEIYNSSRWSMHALPHEHESSDEYRTSHRTIRIVDGDREQLRSLTLHGVLTDSGLWETDSVTGEKKWSDPMKAFLVAMYGMNPTLKDVCGTKQTHVLEAISRKVLLYTKDADAHPEIKALHSKMLARSPSSSRKRMPQQDVLGWLETHDGKRFPDATTHGIGASVGLTSIPEDCMPEGEQALLDLVQQWEMADVYSSDRQILIAGENHPLRSDQKVKNNEAFDNNWHYFCAYVTQRPKSTKQRMELDLEKIGKMDFDGAMAAAMLEANVPFPLGFHVYRMHEKFVGGSAVYFNRQSLVMAVKSCSLLTTNDADTFQTEVQVKFQAGAVVLENRSLLAQHNVVAVRYEDGAGTTFMDWTKPEPRRHLIAVPVPATAEPTRLFSCILGKVPTNILPPNAETDPKSEQEKKVYQVVKQNLDMYFQSGSRGQSIFEADGILRPRRAHQILAMRGACMRYDTHAKRMVDTEEGRTALGKCCSVQQFQQLKGISSELAGDGVRGATFSSYPAFS